MERLKQTFILGAAMLWGMHVLAQTDPIEKFERGIGPHPGDQKLYTAGPLYSSSRPEIRIFYINHVQYRARISEQALLSGPDWTPSKPLPMEFAKVEAIARQELRKLVADASNWEVTGFHLRSVQLSTPDINNLQLRVTKWYFQVEMKPLPGLHLEGAELHSASFWVFIDLSGQAGKIQTEP